MEHIQPVETGIWRWDGVDLDHGFPIVGYIVKVSDGVLLIDPPASSTPEAIRACGNPFAIVVTTPWHVRGTPQWVKEFSIPVAAPASARDELREADLYADRELREGDTEYGWEVIRLTAPKVNDYTYDELALWHADSGVLIIADLVAASQDGTLSLGPHMFGQVPLQDLKPCVQRLADLKPRLLLSAHLGPRTDGAEILSNLLRELDA